MGFLQVLTETTDKTGRKATFFDFTTDAILGRVHETTNLGAHAVMCAAISAPEYGTAIPLLQIAAPSSVWKARHHLAGCR